MQTKGERKYRASVKKNNNKRKEKRQSGSLSRILG